MERINFGRVGAWRVAQPGEVLAFPGGKRDIVIAFAMNVPTPLTLVIAEQEPVPLGLVSGMVEYTIKVAGDVEISATTEDTFAYRTQDGQGMSYETDAPKFVGIIERKSRNLAEERIAFMSLQNAARRSRQMEESLVGMAAMVEELRAAEAERAAAALSAANAETDDDGVTPEGVA